MRWCTVPLTDVLGAAAERGAVDPSVEQRLAEHLPGNAGESVAESLSTPQVQQVHRSPAARANHTHARTHSSPGVPRCWMPPAQCGLLTRAPCAACGQAAQAFTEALNNGSAGGIIAEMGLNPTGLGVEPFCRALQEKAAAEASKPDEPMGEAKPEEPPAEGGDKMDESP